jgi:hypothetical protein
MKRSGRTWHLNAMAEVHRLPVRKFVAAPSRFFYTAILERYKCRLYDRARTTLKLNRFDSTRKKFMRRVKSKKN